MFFVSIKVFLCCKLWINVLVVNIFFCRGLYLVLRDFLRYGDKFDIFFSFILLMGNYL